MTDEFVTKNTLLPQHGLVDITTHISILQNYKVGYQFIFHSKQNTITSRAINGSVNTLIQSRI